MSEIAVLVMFVDHEEFVPASHGQYPVILFDPERNTTWQEIKEQIAQTGAPKVLLQFSNETITIPQHYWNYLDWKHRQYQRLYDAADLIAANSPLACINLLPVLPLPELELHSREINEDSYFLPRLIYDFDMNKLEDVENRLVRSNSEPDNLLALSCFYNKTNRFEEAYATSKKALAQKHLLQTAEQLPEQTTEKLISSSSDEQALLWLAHGLHAARSERYEEAAAAFQKSYTKQHSMKPLFCWTDELMRHGYKDEEIVEPIEKWLESDPHKEETVIRLLHRIGMYENALERCEAKQASSPQLVRIHFDCLIRGGRIAEAVLLFREQGELYAKDHPTDELLCELLLAGDISLKAASLQPYELSAIQERAVALRLFQLAESLQAFIPYSLSLASTLYRNGYVMRSAAYFLQAMKTNTLDHHGYRCLGEILYYRKAYDQSSGIFEYLLSQTPEDTALRTALALSCLRKSETLLNESMHLFPSSIFLKEEAAKVATSIKRIEQSEAITHWRWSERNNFHG